MPTKTTWYHRNYRDDFDSGISSDINKFTDDTKIGRIIRLDSDATVLQVDMDKMNEWTDRWQMQFNINKCKVHSVGRGNPQYMYMINNKALIGSDYEKD